MEKTIGIRREDKNEWEKRVPLVPADVRWLKEKHGIQHHCPAFADPHFQRR